MSRATLTSKGQVTIPKDVRDRLGLESGDRVVFEFEGDAVRLRVERRKSLVELMGSLPATREYPGREAERPAGIWSTRLSKALEQGDRLVGRRERAVALFDRRSPGVGPAGIGVAGEGGAGRRPASRAFGGGGGDGLGAPVLLRLLEG